MKTLRVAVVTIVALALGVVACACAPPFLTLTTSNPQDYASFGQSVAVGDVNGDGIADIAVGAPGEEVGGASAPGGAVAEEFTTGRVYVFSGDDGSQFSWSPLTGGQAGAGFASSLAMGDVNGDGRADIAVGAPYEHADNQDQGRAYVFSGADGSLLLTLNEPNPEVGTTFGFSVVVLDDVTFDGKREVAVGSPYKDIGVNQDQGQAYVLSGADGLLVRTFTASSPQANANFGWSMAAGDLTGDGKRDVVVGAAYEDVGGNADQGRAYAFDSTNGSPLFTLDRPGEGGQSEALFGSSVAVGDVNGDDRGDIAVGAPSEDVLVGENLRTDQGRVYVFSGDDGSDLFTLDSFEQANGYFGDPLAVGDVNGDGHADIAVGAPYQDTGYTDVGIGYVFSGADGSLWVFLTTPNYQNYAYFGRSVALGDVNGNGKADIVAGAPGEDVLVDQILYTGQGRAHVFSAGYPRAATYDYAIECSADGVWVVPTPSGTPDPKGPFVAQGTARVTCGDPTWDENGHQCADCTIDYLNCEGDVGGAHVTIQRLQGTPVAGGAPVPASVVHICEQSPTSGADAVIYIQETDTDGGYRCNCCYEQCQDPSRWGSVACSGTTDGPGEPFSCEGTGQQYDLCCCGGEGNTICGGLDTPRGGGLFTLLGVGGVAEWPGATAGSDQSAPSSSGSGFDYRGLAGAVAAVAVVAVGAWFARRRWAR